MVAAAAVWLAACASGPTGGEAGSASETSASAEAEADKVCTTETGGRLGGRDRRVCRSASTRWRTRKSSAQRFKT